MLSKTNSPFFSIIISTLNEEKYLPKLLNSLTRQSFDNFEVIVVDAYSEDKTVEKAQNYAAQLPSLKIIISPKRLLPYQRNLGAKKAGGKFLIFFDADITIPPEFLEGVHYAIVAYKHRFLTTWLKPDSKTSKDILMMNMANISMELAKAVGKPFAGGFNTIIDKKVFNRVRGYREYLTMSEDHDLALRTYQAGYDLAILKEPRLELSLRRLRSEGTVQVLQKYTKANLYLFLRGPITKKLFDYPMGGHVHYEKERQRKNKKLLELDRYIKKLEKMQKKFVRVLME